MFLPPHSTKKGLRTVWATPDISAGTDYMNAAAVRHAFLSNEVFLVSRWPTMLAARKTRVEEIPDEVAVVIRYRGLRFGQPHQITVVVGKCANSDCGVRVDTARGPFCSSLCQYKAEKGKVRASVPHAIRELRKLLKERGLSQTDLQKILEGFKK